MHEYDQAEHLRTLHVLVTYIPDRYRTAEVLEALVEEIGGRVKGNLRTDSSQAKGDRTPRGMKERNGLCAAIGTLVKIVEVFMDVVTEDEEMGEKFLQPCFAR